jgi:2-amino-4-hydroxy-6-hydroxymethyldihydropteridine diphosphokinase
VEFSAVVGLGGNLGDVEAAIARAGLALRALPSVTAVRMSSLWETAPVGPVTDQPVFVNACAGLVGAPPPRELLAACLRIEAQAGRDRLRETPLGPRPLDLDILLYGDLVMGEPDLMIPHPRLHLRAFALAPLVEIAGPQVVIPGHGQAGDLLAAVQRQSYNRLT